MNLSILTWLARVPCGIVYEIPRVILTQRSRGKANVARNVGSCSHVSFMLALLKIRRVSSSSFRTSPSFQRSHDSLISTSFAGTRRNTRWKRKSRVSPIFSSPPFFHVYTKFYCSPPSSSLFSIKTRGNVSDRHADRERSGRDVGCEQPRVQLPGKGFQG